MGPFQDGPRINSKGEGPNNRGSRRRLPDRGHARTPSQYPADNGGLDQEVCSSGLGTQRHHGIATTTSEEMVAIPAYCPQDEETSSGPLATSGGSSDGGGIHSCWRKPYFLGHGQRFFEESQAAKEPHRRRIPYPVETLARTVQNDGSDTGVPRFKGIGTAGVAVEERGLDGGKTQC